MQVRRWVRLGIASMAPVAALVASGGAAAAGSTDLQQTMPLVDVMFVLSVGGALITFFILVWALVKFRDPATRRRRYG